jgi:polyisoprenoid-binding protein YceI
VSRFAPILLLLSAMSQTAYAETATDTPPPGPIPHGQKDYTLAPAGNYTLDTSHVGIIARVSHLGFSHSIFRFDRAAGALIWDPTAPAHDKLTATVETNSIASNVAGFAAELTGVKYLNAGAFPLATFVSTAFHKDDATHGKVDGTFTLMGKSVTATFNVSLVGAGWFYGHDVIGVHAETAINPKDFGLPSVFDEPIELVIDTEFDRAP